MITLNETGNNIKSLRGVIGSSQLNVLAHNAQRGEETEFFRDKLAEVAEVFRTMPETYGQDGKGLDAVAYLHYFTGGADFYITEKDKGSAGDCGADFQAQAFGLADLGDGGELGYISIPEILSAGAELDLYWTPKTLREIKG